MIKNAVVKLQKESDFYKIGFDYLRLVIKDEDLLQLKLLLEKLHSLDFDNSNFWILNFIDRKLTVIKIKTKAWQALVGTIVHNNISYPILFMEEYSEHTRKLSKSWGRIDFYWVFFRLLEIESIKKIDIQDSLYLFIKHISKGLKISRTDYKIDFFYNNTTKIFKPSDITKLRSNSKVEYKVIGDGIQSWRLWARKSKQYLIRGYDKLADTNAKGKFDLYKEYFNFKSVYRLEFEFLNNYCKGYTYDTFDELREKIEKFLNVDKSYGTLFTARNKDQDIEGVKDRFKYADSTKGYIKGCVNNNINIFWLIEDVFKSMWKSEEEINKIFLDYLKRKKSFEFMETEERDLVYNILSENEK